MMFVKSKDEALLKSVMEVMAESAQQTEEQRKKAAQYLEKTAYAGMRLEEGYNEMTRQAPLRMKVAAAAKMKEQEAKKAQQQSDKTKKEEVELDFNDLLEYMLTSDFEQLDEVSKETLKSYIKKAGTDIQSTARKVGPKQSDYWNARARIERRQEGIKQAQRKLPVAKEEFDQLDEISKGTLGSYIKKATSSSDERSISNLSSRAADKLNNPEGDDTGEKDDKKSFIRSRGIARAVNRLTKEETEIEESIEDRLEAAREKAAAKGKIKEKEPEAQSPVRKVAGKAYGGSKQKEKDEVEESVGSAPKTEREKKLAAMSGDPSKITKGDVLKARGVKMEEVELDEVSHQALSNVFHGRMQQAQKAERGSPEHTKAVSSMKKVSGIMTKRTQQQLKNMSSAEYSKSFAASADQDRKEHPRWTHEEVELDEVVKTTVKAAGKYLSVPTKEIDRYGKVATANAMVGKGGKTEKTGVHSPVKFEEVDLGEAAVHPMAVHVIRHPGGKMQVHAIGSKVQGIEVGEHLHDNDLDDLADMGHKIKEVKPKAVKESRSLSSIISKMVATQQVEEGFEVRFDDGTDEFIEAGIYEAVKAAVQALDEEAFQQVTEYAFGSLTNFMNIHKMVS